MITKELLDYIKAEMAKGDPPDIITKNLSEKGWSPSDINEGLSQLAPAPSNTPPLPAQRLQSFLSNKTSKVLNTSRNLASNVKSGNIKTEVIILAALVFVFLIVFLMPVLTVYAKVKPPFVSDKFRQNIVLFMYHIPLIPKTAEQIVLAAAENNTLLKAYTPDFSLSAKLSTADVAGMSLDLKAKGPVVIPQNNKISYDISFSGSASLVIANFELSGKARKVDDDAYIKLDSLPTALYDWVGQGENNPNSSEIKANIDKLLMNWIAVNVNDTEFNSEAKENLDKNQEPIISQVRKNVQDFLLRSNVLSETKKLKDENIDGVPTYHLRLAPSKSLIRALAREYASHNKNVNPSTATFDLETNFANSVKSMQIDAWFGKKDAILRKTSAVAVFDLNGLSSLLGGGYSGGSSSFLLPGVSNFANTTLSVSTVLKISDVGKEAKISRPSPTMSIKQFGDELQGAFKTKAQREADRKKDTFDKYFSSIEKALSKYYIKNHFYPGTLSELTNVYIPANDPAVGNSSQISYQTSSTKLDFIAFTTITEDTDIYQYGITSVSSYPHKFSKYDVDLIFIPRDSSTPPYR